MSNLPQAARRTNTTPGSEEPLIELEGITKVFGTGAAAFQALKGVDRSSLGSRQIALPRGDDMTLEGEDSDLDLETGTSSSAKKNKRKGKGGKKGKRKADDIEEDDDGVDAPREPKGNKKMKKKRGGKGRRGKGK